ncbi:MAG: cyclic nucleotide-binding domain-containing protein [Nitrospinae bacterium]|jgi:CRP-like cAMP-binding protein|nr:cyclic nucleotide-binding domain-containing protein [Nitrospinota bacterium]MDA1108740.1 cyclic nucleotide-binding domain-containing protein [Nitrospinota bacterium]
MGLHKQVPKTKLHLIKVLDGIPFFDIFDPEEKKEFASSDNYVLDCDPGSVIIEQGDLDFSTYILLKGEVFLTNNKNPDLMIATLKPGAVFGEISFMNRKARPTNVIAKDKASILRLNGELFSKLKSPTQIKLKDQYIELLVSRIAEVNNSLLFLKGELNRVNNASDQFRDDFHKIIKSGARLEGVYENITETIDKLAR